MPTTQKHHDIRCLLCCNVSQHGWQTLSLWKFLYLMGAWLAEHLSHTTSHLTTGPAVVSPLEESKELLGIRWCTTVDMISQTHITDMTRLGTVIRHPDRGGLPQAQESEKRPTSCIDGLHPLIPLLFWHEEICRLQKIKNKQDLRPTLLWWWIMWPSWLSQTLWERVGQGWGARPWPGGPPRGWCSPPWGWCPRSVQKLYHFCGSFPKTKVLDHFAGVLLQKWYSTSGSTPKETIFVHWELLKIPWGWKRLV